MYSLAHIRVAHIQELLRGFMLMLAREEDEAGPSISDFVAHAQAAAAQVPQPRNCKPEQTNKPDQTKYEL